jgi:hypothetical protein
VSKRREPVTHCGKVQFQKNGYASLYVITKYVSVAFNVIHVPTSEWNSRYECPCNTYLVLANLVGSPAARRASGRSVVRREPRSSVVVRQAWSVVVLAECWCSLCVLCSICAHLLNDTISVAPHSQLRLS